MRITALLLLLAASRGWATEPEQADYMLNCQGCHLADGSGFPARQVPDLRQQMARFLVVPGGRAFLVQVPGSAQSALSDAGLARVLNWMLLQFSPAQLPEGFQPFTAAEVSTLRKSPLVNVSQVRTDLLERVALQEQLPANGGSAP